jgi:hypothetical protein
MTVGRIPPKYNPNDVYPLKHLQPPYPLLLAESGAIGVQVLPNGAFNVRSTLGAIYELPTKLAGWQIPQEPLISIRGGKMVKETPLNRGRRVQNVIEEVNLNNYQVRISGLLQNEDEDFEMYPAEAVARLREIIETPGSIEIENQLTSIWGINKIVIVNIDFPEVDGNITNQPFELYCISDQNFELELIDSPERL